MKNKTSVFQLGIKSCHMELNNYFAHFLHDMPLTAALQKKGNVLHATIFFQKSYKISEKAD